MSSTNRGAKRSPSDFYPTPHFAALGMARELAEIARLAGVDQPLVVDAGAGTGALTRAVRETIPGAYIVGVEIEAEPVAPVQASLLDAPVEVGTTEGLVIAAGADLVHIGDWREWTCGTRPFAVVSNPPFYLADDFIRHTIEDVDPLFAMFLLRHGILGGRDRVETLWSDPRFEPGGLRTIIPRPDFSGGGGDSADYAWFLWSREGEIYPPIGWHVDGVPLLHGASPRPRPGDKAICRVCRTSITRGASGGWSHDIPATGEWSITAHHGALPDEVLT